MFLNNCFFTIPYDILYDFLTCSRKDLKNTKGISGNKIIIIDPNIILISTELEQYK